MGQRFEIKGMRVRGWLRMHDTQTGEQFEVPVKANTILQSGDDEQHRHDQENGSAGATTTTGDAAARTDRPKRAKKKSTGRKKSLENDTAAEAERSHSAFPTADSSPWASDKPNPLETQEGRMKPLDEKSLTDADRKVMDDHQQFWAHVQAVTTKRGGLGWEETTDAGRSGLRARHKAGAFKILHAGGDTYALFYEWDSGKFEKIACGKAEELMELAQQRTQEKLPPPPRTLLDLEMARHMCASDPEQRRIAAERLAPIFRELEAAEQERQENEAPPPPRTRRRRTSAPPVQPIDATPTADAIDPKLDETLLASFKQALAETEEA